MAKFGDTYSAENGKLTIMFVRERRDGDGAWSPHLAAYIVVSVHETGGPDWAWRQTGHMDFWEKPDELVRNRSWTANDE